MINTDLNVESVVEEVIRRIVNETHERERLDEKLAFFNSPESVNRQNMRKANRALRRSGDPDAKAKIRQNRQAPRAANKTLRRVYYDNGPVAYHSQKPPTLSSPQTNNPATSQTSSQPVQQTVGPKQPSPPAAQRSQPVQQAASTVDYNNPDTWPDDAKAAFQFVHLYQNYPRQGAGWVSNLRGQGVGSDFIQHVRNIINRWYANAGVTQASPSQTVQAQPVVQQTVQERRARFMERKIAETVRRVILEAVASKQVYK